MKKILSDVDGVMLLWEPAFHRWMAQRNHVLDAQDTRAIHQMYPALTRDEGYRMMTEFANSSWIGFLEPERDAKQGIAELVWQGYIFDVITSLGTDPYTTQLRTMNLNDQFGSASFDKYVYVEMGASKAAALAPYAGTGYYWIEDKPENAEAGLDLGLQPILIDHPHNQWYDHPQIFRVSTWKEVVDIILNSKTL
jgi:FMN phosphatase YigB (HAD superfamily)